MVMYTAVFKMDNQEGPTLLHRELAWCYLAAWMGVGLGENGNMCMYG